MSSSATIVMLVSFVQAQLMTFAQSLGIILSADIGTIIATQLIAFKRTDSALLCAPGDPGKIGTQQLDVLIRETISNDQSTRQRLRAHYHI